MTDTMELYIPGTLQVQPGFLPVVGKKYYKKSNLSSCVKEVVAVDDTHVAYRVIHAPKGTPLEGVQRLSRFRKWADGEFIGDDPRILDGAIIRPTFIALNTSGEPIFRCSYKRARFYVNKGHAVKLDDQTIQFKDDFTEKNLLERYNGKFNGFFMAVKNDKCVCCGKTTYLTRHHVVPKRHIAKLSREVRNRISNVLFICWQCHSAYEKQQLVSESLDPRVWRDHFVETMKPQHLHPDWDIFSVKS